MLATALMSIALTLPGQGASVDAMLEVIPAEADVVIRLSGLEATRADVAAMIEAMSPAVAQSALPGLQQGMDEFTAQFGQEAANVPFVAAMRVVQPKNPNQPPFAVVVPGENDQAILGSLPGGGADQKPLDGGYRSFQGPQGATWYSCKGDGWVAFGGDESLIKAIAKKGESSFAQGMTEHQREKFVGGDVAIGVNVSVLAERYSAQIEKAKEQFMGALDQAGNAGGNADSMKFVKELYGQMFDSADQLDRLVVQINFEKEGLDLTGELSVKPGSGIADLLAGSTPGTSVELGSMPADMAYYMAYSVSARQMAKMQAWGMQAMGSMVGENSAITDAMKAMGDQGSVRTIASARIDRGIHTVNLIDAKDPTGYLASSIQMMKAMKSDGEGGPTNFVKSVEVEEGAQMFKGYNFTEVVLQYDLEKMTAMQGPANAQALGSVQAILGDGTIRSWMAADDQRLLTVSAPDWEQAKVMLEAALSDSGGVKELPSFKTVRGNLPEKTNVLFLISMQGLVRQLAAQLGPAMGNPDLKAPATLPKEPAFLGFSATTETEGVDFDLFIPSPVGRVIEEGLVPMIQEMQGKVVR